MKKLLLSALLIPILFFNAFGQAIENPGFEDWEDAGTVIDEPVNWSSIKTSDAGSLVNNAAPVVWGQSDDAHTGNYSIELTNVLTLGTIIATGTITNGRVHADFNPNAAFIYTNPDDERWHTTFTGRPDSVIVWAKYTPAGTDTAQVKVLLHVNEGTLPITPENQMNRIGYAQINITGTVDTWTRFAAAFEYDSEQNPEYILMALTSGAGITPIDGSIVLFDDLELVGGSSGINDPSVNTGYLYSFNGSLYFDKLQPDLMNDATLQVFQVDGTKIIAHQLADNQSKLDLDLNLKKGIYLIQITSKENNYTQKMYFR